MWLCSAASFRVHLKQISISLALFMNTGRVFIESITRKGGMVLQSVHEVSSVALKAFGHIPNRFLFCLVLKMNGY